MNKTLRNLSFILALCGASGLAFGSPLQQDNWGHDHGHGHSDDHGHGHGDHGRGHDHGDDRGDDGYRGRYVRDDDGYRGRDHHDNGWHRGWHRTERWHHWARGERYGGPVYVVRDYRDYRLAPPPRGYRWVRGDNDNYLLVAITTGLILNIVTH
ncbi:RcnB family protein [Dyella sp. A6]|uniref:RcnB family protein n=1 Tax=Dyella aluminiiresistens TaxID=3069105 RepID=UPI002E763AD8|nr:RcnB family protein [Dyella sp. A6]